MENIILATDSYKASHFSLYPPDVTGLYSYIESRGGKFKEILFFGLQYAITKYLGKPITKEMINEAEGFFSAHGEPFNRKGWEKVLDVYGGYLPIKIRAVPEGTLVPVGVPLVTVECEDPDLFWLASYVETWVLRCVWYSSTVATTSFMAKRLIKKYLEKTGDVGGIGFKLHDFGARGVSSQESAMIGGAAHLVNFLGSDTIEGIWCANKYYNSSMAGFSIPALEHSITTAWGKDRERDCFEHALSVYGGEGKLLACVSDSYDIFNAVDNIWGKELKQAVINSKATVVIRPDSGDPVEVVTKVMISLGNSFGYELNSKGYKVLNNVRVIQGDGVNLDSIEKILHSLELWRFSTDNIAFGMGGALLQHCDRDTNKFAMKASAKKVGNKWIGINKDPVTDSGKASKKGRISASNLISASNFSGSIKCVEGEGNLMRTIYENGKIGWPETLDNIRNRANSWL